MKKLSIVFLILINSLACSKGQNKQYSGNANLSIEILGCWKAVDAHYEIKSNYPNIDSLSLKNRKQYVAYAIDENYITKYKENNVVQFYNLDGTEYERDWYYEIKYDSLSIEDRNTPRIDTRSTSKITIDNDTLYHEIKAFDEINDVLEDLKWNDNIEIPDDIKIETAKRYTKFVRVKDCDQYKKEDE